MKKIIIFIIFVIVVNFLYATEILFKLGIVCKNDPNLTLKKATITDNSTDFVFLYKNNGQENKSIGINPPNTDSSIFLYNSDATKIYLLTDMEGLPKWWPKKKYVLKPREEIEFTLHFEKIEPTTNVKIIEGKNNFNSTTGWNFLNVPVNSYSFVCKQTIEYLDKPQLTQKENNTLLAYKKYDFVNDFISYYTNKSDDLKKIYLSKWKNDIRASYFIDYLLKKDYDKLTLKPNLAKADSIIINFPNSTIAKKLQKFIKPLLIKQLHNDYISLQSTKDIKDYALFLNKYAKFGQIYNDLQDLSKAKDELRKLLEAKREELKVKGDVKSYNDFFAKYGKKNFINTIYKDYQELEKKKYNETVIINTPQAFDTFLSNFPDSKYTKDIHKKYYEYFKTNRPTLDVITDYAGKYPNSPYINEVIKLVPQTVASKNTKSSKTSKINYSSPEQKLEAFKASLKEGDVVHFIERIRVGNPSNPSKEETYNIQYTAKVVMVLKTKVRVKIVDASLLLDNPPDYVLSSFQDLKDVMVGTIEDEPISKLKEFKEF